MSAASVTPKSRKETAAGIRPDTTRTRRANAITAAGAKAAQNERALVLLTDLCSTLEVGERLPLHVDLMRRFEVSERAILRAFDELQRQRRIIRKPGLGTLVAERPEAPDASAGGAVANSLLIGQSAGISLDQSSHSDDTTQLGLPSWSIIAVAHADHSFYESCLETLCAYADDGGLPVFCKPLRVGEQPPVERLGSISFDPEVCRFVIFGYQLMPLAKQISNRGGRVVVVGTPPIGAVSEVPCVYGNQDFGGYLITRQLIETGHRHLGFFHYDNGLAKSLRWQGHQRALREARRRGADVKDSFVMDVLSQWEESPALAAAFFRGDDAPDAMILWNDREAVRMLAVLKRAGVRVPYDVSVTGYDNLPDGRITDPAMTTIDPGTDHQLRAAIDILTEPDAADGGKTAVVIPSLVVRESTTMSRQKRSMAAV